jgi:hypothetical protein
LRILVIVEEAMLAFCSTATINQKDTKYDPGGYNLYT